jgi:hypothetical protein
MRHPERHIVEAELTERGVEIHFQARGFGGERSYDLCVVWSRAEELGVITARFLPGGIKSKLKGRGIENRRFGIRHRQDHGHAAGKRRLGSRIPIFLVGLSGFAHVDMGIDQAGESEHKSGYRYKVRRQKKRAANGSLNDKSGG